MVTILKLEKATLVVKGKKYVAFYIGRAIV